MHTASRILECWIQNAAPAKCRLGRMSTTAFPSTITAKEIVCKHWDIHTHTCCSTNLLFSSCCRLDRPPQREIYEQLEPVFTCQTLFLRPKQTSSKEEYLYSTIYSMRNLKALRHGSHSFTSKLQHACLSFVSVHQIPPPLTEVADIRLQLTTH